MDVSPPLGLVQARRLPVRDLVGLWSTDLPVVIEIVDAEEKIKAFLPVVDQLVTEGMVTLEAVRIVKYVAAPSGRRTG